MQTIGVDGGGTRTRAIALDAEGRVLGWALAGCGNYQTLGDEGLARLVDDLLARLPAAAASGRSLCLALAGAGRPAERRAVGELAGIPGWAATFRVVSDGRAALEGAHGGSAGLIVISGTGSMVLGKDAAGREARAGGYGPLLGDQGSGYALGQGALRAVFQARDGWGPPTCLERELLTALELAGWDEVVPAVYRGPVGRERIAALAPCVFAAARGGDRVARELVEAAGRALGCQVAAVGERLGLGSAAVVAGVGGVFCEVDALWPALAAAARDRLPGLTYRSPLLPPVLGAALLARQAAGMETSVGLADSLRGALPLPS
ncbi:MAG: BadF/BadG/BcrA/BcrD ATPase family protein [Candidatus Latescibacterota bacterium]|jgi:N-acetylglucosamine kinase-like BadF-type ATPase